MGGFQVVLDLWELAILPTLLYNSGTWVEMDRETEKRLEDLQPFFLRLFLQVSVSTPCVALRSETGMLAIRLRVEKEKVMLVVAAEEICGRLGIEDVNGTMLEKKIYRKILREAVTRDE